MSRKTQMPELHLHFLHINWLWLRKYWNAHLCLHLVRVSLPVCVWVCVRIRVMLRRRLRVGFISGSRRQWRSPISRQNYNYHVSASLLPQRRVGGKPQTHRRLQPEGAHACAACRVSAQLDAGRAISSRCWIHNQIWLRECRSCVCLLCESSVWVWTSRFDEMYGCLKSTFNKWSWIHQLESSTKADPGFSSLSLTWWDRDVSLRGGRRFYRPPLTSATDVMF